MSNIPPPSPPSNPPAAKPRLLEVVRQRIRAKHYSLRTEEAYVHWIRHFVAFHGKRHPRDMGAPEVEAFLSHLANARNVSVSTHRQALAALLFLYKDVLGIDLPWLASLDRPQRPARLPTVLTQQEITRLFACMEGTHLLMARLLYGTGMRLTECAQLRVKDVDFQRRQITIRQGKGNKDRMTVLPGALAPDLQAHVDRVHGLWEQDRRENKPGVFMPDALDRKYPEAGKSWGWFWVFPARTDSTDPRTGIIRRHHVYQDTLQRAIKKGLNTARIAKPASTIPYATASPPTCSNPATTSAPYKNCSATRT